MFVPPGPADYTTTRASAPLVPKITYKGSPVILGCFDKDTVFSGASKRVQNAIVCYFLSGVRTPGTNNCQRKLGPKVLFYPEYYFIQSLLGTEGYLR